MGGFDLALNRLGGQCVMASEIDKYARKAYEVIFGMEPQGDVTKIDAADVPDHDLLAAGFPCQAFSVAGKRLGFEDTRGTLFFEVARIAKEKRPKVLLLENVKGLVGHNKGKTIETIILVLNDIGYAVDFQVLNSKYFGVPQNRERVFFVCIRDDLVEREPWVIEGSNVVAKAKKRISQIDGVKTFNFDWPEQTEVTTRLRDILEDNVDERFYLSEEKTAKLVAQLEKTTGETPKDFKDGDVLQRSMSGVHKKDIYGTLRAGASRTEFGVIEPQPEMLGLLDIKGQENIRRVDATTGISPTLTTMGGGHREPKMAELAKPDDISYCIDANYSKGTAPCDVGKGRRTHIIEQVKSDLKNLVGTTRNGIDFDIKTFENGDMRAHRLDAKKSTLSEWVVNNEENQSATVSCAHAPKIYGETTRYRIRKLTPRECFRLQGFPDEIHDALERAGISNSQRYKMAGNAVTVNVVEAIGRRLLPWLEGGDQ